MNMVCFFHFVSLMQIPTHFSFKYMPTFLHSEHPSAMNSTNTQIATSAVSIMKAVVFSPLYSVFLCMLRFSKVNKFSTV